MKTQILTAALALTVLALPACSKHRKNKDSGASGTKSAAQTGPAIIAIDGSSTVFPINEAVAEEFQKANHAKVTIGVSGTGGGFKKFCSGEISVAGASRPIKPTEVKMCADSRTEYIELPVAYDGLSVVVNPDNDWVDHITVQELKTLWEPAAQNEVTKWSQVRAGWPDKAIRLFGPGVDSGTYDYFTKAIVGVEHKSRGDFTSSEDDNVLVQGVATDRYALGFFGFAYYSENANKLKLVAIEDGDDENGKGPIQPSEETVADGTYQPLSRPIFIYVNKAHASRPSLEDFVEFYLEKGESLVRETGYIPLSEKAQVLVSRRFERRTTGSLFEGKGSTVGATVEMLLSE